MIFSSKVEKELRHQISRLEKQVESLHEELYREKVKVERLTDQLLAHSSMQPVSQGIRKETELEALAKLMGSDGSLVDPFEELTPEEFAKENQNSNRD